MTNEEIAYVAGIFDGEGCVTCSLHESGTLSLRLVISNTNEEVLAFIQNLFGGSIHNKTHKNRNNKECFELRFEGDTGKAFVEAVEKYSIIKKNQLKLASMYFATRWNRDKAGSLLIKNLLGELNK